MRFLVSCLGLHWLAQLLEGNLLSDRPNVVAKDAGTSHHGLGQPHNVEDLRRYVVVTLLLFNDHAHHDGHIGKVSKARLVIQLGVPDVLALV